MSLLSIINILRRLRNATSRINTAFFVYIIKKSPLGYGIIELLETKNQITKRRHLYDTTKTTLFGRYF